MRPVKDGSRIGRLGGVEQIQRGDLSGSRSMAGHGHAADMLGSAPATPIIQLRVDPAGTRAAAVHGQAFPCWATGGASAGSKAEENR